MTPNDLNYNAPQSVYLMVGAIVIFVLFFRLFTFRENILRHFAEATVLNAILIPRSRYNYWAKTTALSLAWIFAVIALMEPRGNGRYPLQESLSDTLKKPISHQNQAVIQRKAHDILFLIDASASMEVNDTRTGQTRLEFAKDIVDQVISNLKGENVALVAFTSDTTTLSPPTMDYMYVRLMLRHMHINEGNIAGTNILKAISEMHDAYYTHLSTKLKTLVILTDGGDTMLEELKGNERQGYIQKMLGLLKNAQDNHLRVFTVGMGSEQGKTIPGIEYQGKPVVSSLDEDLLTEISKAGGGQEYFANHWTAMDLAQELTEKIENEHADLQEYKVKTWGMSKSSEDNLVYDLFYQFPLGLCIVFLGLVIFFPDTRIRKLG